MNGDEAHVILMAISSLMLNIQFFNFLTKKWAKKQLLVLYWGRWGKTTISSLLVGLAKNGKKKTINNNTSQMYFWNGVLNYDQFLKYFSRINLTSFKQLFWTVSTHHKLLIYVSTLVCLWEIHHFVILWLNWLSISLLS